MNKKFFWSLFTVATLFSLWFSYTYFDKAISFVHLSITMNKSQAEQKAIKLSEQMNWPVQGYDHVTFFDKDDKLQAFTELEGGGKKAFVEMIEKDYHQPFVWRVRFFKEKEIKETFIWFTPDGRLYGFKQKLPEAEVGNNISKSKAQSVAEQSADSWDVNLKNYKLVEYEEQVRPSKRVDHSFVYERTDVTVGKGLYRVKIVVAGDQLVRVKHFVKIPDEFDRRYAQMRSYNNLLTGYGQGIEFILYLLVLGMFALFFLYKKRYLLPVATAKVMAVFAVLLGLVSINNWPLVWNGYMTTVPKSLFVFQQVFGTIVMGIAFVAFVGLICLIAEAVGRYLFGKHVQFYQVWSPQAAGSYSIAEQTVLGYCGAAIMLAFMLSFYMLAGSWGWWAPLQSIDFNVLSSYVPFFSPVVYAFRAGFWEEFSSRALPIAGIMLFVRNWKSKNIWFWTMIGAQAILFGAAHANYPMQPAYYRIVEIFIPSLGFAWMYVQFGLLPGIITHGVYDAVYFLLPIFRSDSLIQKVGGVLMVGIPLWIVIARFIQQSKLHTLASKFYNSAFKPEGSEVTEKKFVREQGSVISQQVKNYTWMCGLVGLLLFATSKEFQFDTPPAQLSMKQAEQQAQQTINDRYGDIGTGWTRVAKFMDTFNNEGNKFVWQTYGKEVYQQLQGSYVIEPYYSVRFARFNGSVESKAKEYGVWISATGKILNVWHKLPEAKQGADISENKAQELASDFIQGMYQLDKKDIEFVSIDSTKHENRRDYNIYFQDIKNYQLDKGQGRIVVSMAGDQIVGSYRFVYSPEEWKRAQHERASRNGLIQIIFTVLYSLFMMFFVYLASVRIGINSKILTRIAGLAGILFVIKTINLLNKWNEIVFVLKTTEPVANQINMIVISHLVSSIPTVFGLAALVVAGLLLNPKGSSKGLGLNLVTSAALGAVFLGLFSITLYFQPTLAAHSPAYDFMNFVNSPLAIVLFFVSNKLFSTIVGVTVLIVGAAYLSNRYNSELLRIAIFVTGGIISNVMELVALDYFTLPMIFVSGAIIGFVWYVVWRYLLVHNIELIIPMSVIVSCLRLLPTAWYYAYPFVRFDVMFASVIAMILASYGYKKLVTA